MDALKGVHFLLAPTYVIDITSLRFPSRNEISRLNDCCQMTWQKSFSFPFVAFGGFGSMSWDKC
jgi:hypothetical protein